MALILGTYDDSQYFIVTTENVLEPLGVKVTEVTKSLIPPTRDNSEEVPGRHGEIDHGSEFKADVIELKVCTPDGLTAEKKEQYQRNYAKYLNPLSGEKKLIFMNDPNIVYKVKYSGKITPTNYSSWREFVIPFKMNDPFKYSYTEKSLIGSGNAVNNGTFESGLIIEISGAVTNPSLTVDGVTLSYSGTIGAGQKLVVNTDAKTAYIGTSNAVNDWNDKFPKIQPGTHAVVSSSNITIKWFDKYL